MGIAPSVNMDSYGHMWTNMDKKPSDEKIMHSGEKLRVARQVKGLQVKDVINALGITKDAIDKWEQYRGIPDKDLWRVSKFFEVEEWVFTDESLELDDFRRIIDKPELMDGYRPEIRPKIRSGSLKLIKGIKKPVDSKMFKSDLFHISSETVLLKMCVWCTIKHESAYFSFVNKERRDKYFSDKMLYYGYDKHPHFYVSTEEDNLDKKIIREEIINDVKKGDHYISWSSIFDFELFIFELY